MSHHVIAHINLSALRDNLQFIKHRVPQCPILAMVKRDGYSHGAVPVAKALESGVAVFGVANLEEALELYEAKITKPILIMMGFCDAEELMVAARCGLHTVVHSEYQLDLLEQTAVPNKINIWLKIDTGMHRLGFAPARVKAVYQRLVDSGKVNAKIRFMTHFSDADDITHTKTAVQIKCFDEAVAGLPVTEYSLANSSAILNWPAAHHGFARPGILLYGVSPLANPQITGAGIGVKPVMTLKSKIITMHDLQKGDTVGYGSTWTCPTAMRVGIAAIGYGDGYPRSAKSGTPLLVNDVQCALIGRVAMDMITLDLRNCPNAKIGDEVTLWGSGLPLETVAQYANSISYELLCRMTKRVHYHYHD